MYTNIWTHSFREREQNISYGTWGGGGNQGEKGGEAGIWERAGLQNAQYVVIVNNTSQQGNRLRPVQYDWQLTLRGSFQSSVYLNGLICQKIFHHFSK